MDSDTGIWFRVVEDSGLLGFRVLGIRGSGLGFGLGFRV